jgi:hypothetical protein
VAGSFRPVGGRPAALPVATAARALDADGNAMVLFAIGQLRPDAHHHRDRQGGLAPACSAPALFRLATLVMRSGRGRRLGYRPQT